MYEFKVELKKELLDGRTIKYISDKIGITRTQLTQILNGKQTTRKLTAYCIIKECKPESEINDYFKMKG